MRFYTCPVCGYDRLEDPPKDFTICDSCGTEFGYQDARRSHASLRSEWLSTGARWHSIDFPPPPGWNAMTQLAKAGFVRFEMETATRSHGNVAGTGSIGYRFSVGKIRQSQVIPPSQTHTKQPDKLAA